MSREKVALRYPFPPVLRAHPHHIRTASVQSTHICMYIPIAKYLYAGLVVGWAEV